VWAPPRLAYDSTGHAFGTPPGQNLAFDERHVAVLRRGMWKVVNDRGTGKEARLSRTDYELCGKRARRKQFRTPLRTVTRSNGRMAGARGGCLPRGRRPSALRRRAATLCGSPRGGAFSRPGDRRQAAIACVVHGFNAVEQHARGHAPTGRVYALAIMIEFGGSGGHTAAPVAKQIAEYLLE